MKIQTSQFYSELISLVQSHIKITEELKSKAETKLNQKISADSWCALECIEHLNRYGNFYLPEIENRIKSSSYPPEDTFKSGILGNYFTNIIKPKEKLNKMKSPKNMNPLDTKLDSVTLDIFLKQLHQALTMLEESKAVSLNKTKVSISISKHLKLKLGDTFRFFIYHNERHLQQAIKATCNIIV
ncbi:DinB family protein [Elizabethkingia anophelis]|uniref:DinB family protein n=1 Tax=Elizabethkingia anophelis TaxID=1117645 RepID=UPI000C6E90EA|nr:DinB family protein [Elizabethkingia anophelis]MCT3646471.1 DinB family protein [Elizabethkingia anophelis]MCT3647557.1 DinB family protein [Elizabethkingia anophelis]MCT3694080.1 DinB family protein [Elizabethkingia anophelis]MCT3700434.1 DinB family protein [Elizabethkingia anophelis]MCT3759718.1 DinB family protein [Elizabethkingia anophelis]